MGFTGAAAILVAGAAHAVATYATHAPPPVAATPISQWTALATYSIKPEENPLCYWDVEAKHWIPADSDRGMDLRQRDPSPVYRERNAHFGRCDGAIPPADVATLGAVLGAFVYIAAHDDNPRESVSPN